MAGIAFVAGDVEEVGDVEWSVGGDQHTRAETATVLGQCKKRLSFQRPERDFFTFWKPEDGVGVPPCFQDGSLEELRQQTALPARQLVPLLPRAQALPN